MVPIVLPYNSEEESVQGGRQGGIMESTEIVEKEDHRDQGGV